MKLHQIAKGWQHVKSIHDFFPFPWTKYRHSRKWQIQQSWTQQQKWDNPYFQEVLLRTFLTDLVLSICCSTKSFFVKHTFQCFPKHWQNTERFLLSFVLQEYNVGWKGETNGSDGLVGCPGVPSGSGKSLRYTDHKRCPGPWG